MRRSTETNEALQGPVSNDIAGLVFDHDNCVLQAISELSNLEINSLFSHLLITSKTLPSSFQLIYLGIGSLRQSVWYDRYALLYNALIKNKELKLNGSIFHSLNTLTEALEEMYPQKIRRQPLVLADCSQTDVEKERGSYLDLHSDDFGQDMAALTEQIAQSKAVINETDVSFLEWLQKQQESAYYRCSENRTAEIERHWLHVLGSNDAFSDTTKWITLFIHAHDLANKHPHQSIKLIFVDDLEKYAKYFSSILQYIPFLIPSNVTFTPIQYDHSRKDIFGSRLLDRYENKGTGKVDRDYKQTALSWATACEKNNVNEWMISSNLLKRMRSHFEKLNPHQVTASYTLPTLPVPSSKMTIGKLLSTEATKSQYKPSKEKGSNISSREERIGEKSPGTNPTLKDSMNHQLFGATFKEQDTSPKASAEKPFGSLRSHRYAISSLPHL
jgi:hypothetical protein